MFAQKLISSLKTHSVRELLYYLSKLLHDRGHTMVVVTIHTQTMAISSKPSKSFLSHLVMLITNFKIE